MPLRFLCLLLATSCLLTACGDDDNLTVMVDDDVIEADEGTTIRTIIGGEGTLEFETNLGGLWFGSDQTFTSSKSYGGSDVPFRCRDEIGIATIHVTWIEESITESVTIECVQPS